MVWSSNWKLLKSHTFFLLLCCVLFTCSTWAWRKWKEIPKEDKKRRATYFSILLSIFAVAAIGPHRHKKVGQLWNVREWRLWTAWLKFVAFEIIQDKPHKDLSFDTKKDQAIVAVVPHGIFPFALAFAALPAQAARAFGEFRPVVATATGLFPFVRTFLSWIGAM